MQQRMNLIGFRNFGSTCYINTVFQCLFSCESFIKNIKNIVAADNESKLINEINDCLEKVLKAKVGNILEPKKLLKIIFKESNMAFSNSETDSHEFLTWLLDEVWKSSCKNDSILIRGIFEIAIKCHCCNGVKIIHEPFSSIILGTPYSNDDADHMNTLIKNEFKAERINYRSCDYCNKIKSAIKSTSIQKMPQVLIFTIKKYDCNKKITFNENIKINNCMYELRSISCYTGNFENGHYYSIIKNKHEYFIVDDETITLINFNQINLSHIYVVFYNMIPDRNIQ